MVLGRDPILLLNLLQASLGTVTLFGMITITPEQMGGIMVFFAALLSFIIGRAVTPNAEVAALILESQRTIEAKNLETQALRAKALQNEAPAEGSP